MLYQLYSAAALADATIYFEIAVWFKRRDGAAFSEILKFPFYPVSGTAKADIRSIIDPQLEYELPNLTDGLLYENPLFAKKATGFFYIKYREITVADPDPAWSTDASNERFCIKGGIAYQKWRGDNYWINYFDIEKPFLTWQESGRQAAIDERMYLPWLNLTDVAEGKIMMRRKLVFTDLSEDYAFIDFQVLKYDVGMFPCGATQLKLDLVDPDKNIYYWELQVFDVTDTMALAAISNSFRYYADNRKDYNDITLNYRNSLGGIDSAMVRGVIDYNLVRTFTEQERVAAADYFNTHFISPKKIAADSEELQVYKGDLGLTDKEAQDRLRDLHYQRECWWYQQNKWLPVMIMTGNEKLRSSGDKLFAMPVEFAVADGGDNYYTPANINLQEGNDGLESLCNAVITVPTWSFIPGTGWRVEWTLTSGTPIKYLISTPGVNGGVPFETTGLLYDFAFLPVGTNIISVRPVCQIGEFFYQGAVQTVSIVVASSCVGVTIDVPNSDMGPWVLTLGVPMTGEIKLLGTPPFNLDSTLKPAWLHVSLAGDTVSFFGTPDVLTDPLLINIFKFRMSNCLFNNNVFYTSEYSVT